MGHGHGEHKFEFPEMPDFRSYKVEDVPMLLETQRKLACHGLHDPWLRNEVWKYKMGNMQPPLSVYLSTLKYGFKYGLVIALVATAISKTFKRKVEHH